MKYPNKQIARNPAIAWQEVNEAMVVVTPKTKKVHILNGSGASIFKILQKPATIEDMVSSLCQEYDVDRETAEVDIGHFIEDLAQKDIILL